MAGSESLRRKDREDRYVGALLGTAYGDALGAGVEGWSRGEILRRFGEVRDFLPQRGAGRYTDDTQMTLALALSLIRVGDVDGADCARSYAELFEPERGYGRSSGKDFFVIPIPPSRLKLDGKLNAVTGKNQ